MFLKIFTNKRVRQAYVKLIIKAVISILCIGIALFLIVACIRHYRYSIQNVQSLEDITARGRKNEMRLASYELTELPEYIGTVDDLNYYFIYSPDSNNEFCVIFMFNSYYDEMEKELKENGKANLRGSLEKITESVVVEYICQYIENNNIKVDTGDQSLEDYIYKYPMMQYCEMSKIGEFINITFMYLLWIFVFGGWGCATVLDNLISVKRSNGIFPAGVNYAERINIELNSADAKWFEINKIYITQNYLVALGNGILFFEINSIKKMYGNTTENYSIGGLTYIEELFVEYCNGQIYKISEVTIHALQMNLLERYQEEKDNILIVQP